MLLSMFLFQNRPPESAAPPATLRCRVEVDAAVRAVAALFDHDTQGLSEFHVPPMPEPPAEYGIGLIVGPSGSGKSTLLSRFGSPAQPHWESGKAIISHFPTPEEGASRLSAVGFNSVPSWIKPYRVLSNGEKFRADMARAICSGAAVDEFTSVVDRDVAKACAYAVRRYTDKENLRHLTFASCHYDIIPWLQPDWVYDTASRQMTLGRSERRPEIVVKLVPCGREEWSLFRDHHYLAGNISSLARCWVVTWGGRKIGFTSCLAFPNQYFKNAWREHRTVILPEFQGLGIGTRVSDALGEMVLSWGGRFFSKTAHIRMGGYRENSPLWRPTSGNRRKRTDYKNPRLSTKEDGHRYKHAARVCFSHEYLGKNVLDSTKSLVYLGPDRKYFASQEA